MKVVVSLLGIILDMSTKRRLLRPTFTTNDTDTKTGTGKPFLKDVTYLISISIIHLIQSPCVIFLLGCSEMQLFDIICIIMDPKKTGLSTLLVTHSPPPLNLRFFRGCFFGHLELTKKNPQFYPLGDWRDSTFTDLGIIWVGFLGRKIRDYIFANYEMFF